MPESGPKIELEELTGLRFFAAFVVLMYHIGRVFLEYLFPEFWHNYYKFIFNGGYLGVDLFFVLSGFVIAYNYRDRFLDNEKGQYFSFLRKRFARLYPIHIATMLGLGLAGYFMSGGDFLVFGDMESFVKNLLLVHAVFPPGEWNTVSWSISCEWLAYCAFPLFALLFRNCNSQKQILTVISVITLFSLGLFAICIIKKIPADHQAYRLIRISCEFPVGVLLYQLWARESKKGLSELFKHWVVPALGVLVILISHSPLSFVFVVPFFYLLVYLIASDQFFLNKYLRIPAVIYGGKISYSLYMVHGMTMIAFDYWMSNNNYNEADDLSKLVFVLFYFFVTMALSSFFYHVIEEPCRRMLVKSPVKK